MRRHQEKTSINSDTQILELAAAIKDGLFSAAVKKPTDHPDRNLDDDDDLPHVFICPISLQPMKDPVTLCTGHTYDRSNISRWLSLSPRRPPICPTSMQELWDTSLTPNTTLLHLLRAWISHHDLHRPAHRAADLVAALNNAKGRHNKAQALGDLRRLLVSHPASVQSIVDSGGVPAISSLLGPFTSHAVGSGAIAVLSSLPLDSASVADLMQPAKISLVVDLLNDGSTETKINCTRFLATLMRDRRFRPEMVSSPSLLVGLMRLVRDGKRHPSGGAAGLGLLRAVSSHREVLRPLVSVGVAQQLLESLPALEGECLELALHVLRALCTTPEGRAAVRDWRGAVRRLVNVLVGMTERCTELGLGILLLICREWPEECGKAAVDAGAAAKLLLALQSGCAAATKRSAAELLKLCSLNYGTAMFMSKCKLTRTMQ